MAKHALYEKLVAETKKKITEISPQDAAARSKSGEAVIVDVRETDEWDEEHIPGAMHLSRGTIELDIEEKVPDPNALIAIAAEVAVRRLRPRVYKRWATKTSAPWPEALKHGKPPDCQRRTKVVGRAQNADPEQQSRSVKDSSTQFKLRNPIIRPSLTVLTHEQCTGNLCHNFFW